MKRFGETRLWFPSWRRLPGSGAGRTYAVFAIRADRDEVGEELEKMLVKSFGKHAVCLAEAGASITINAGPNLVGCMVMGERRK